MMTFNEYLSEERFAVVDELTNKPRFITKDAKAAGRVAAELGMVVRQIFGPKNRTFNHIKLVK